VSTASLVHREVEEAVLAAALLDQELATRAATELSPEDFGHPPARLIFGALGRLHRAGKPFDVRTAQAALEEAGELERAGGVGYIATIDLSLPDLSRFQHYAGILRASSLRRRLIETCGEAATAARSGQPTPELIAELADNLRSLQERGASGKAAPITSALTTVRHRLAHPAPRGMIGVPSGMPGLDQITQGWQPGQLIVLAGRPGAGKTVAATGWAMHSAKSGGPVLFMSLEMGADELAARVASASSSVPLWQIRSGYLADAQKKAVERSIAELEKVPLYIDDSPILTPARLSATIRRAQREHDVQMVVVDYLGLMQPDAEAENQNLRLAAMTRSLKLLAKELELPIVTVHQLNRAPEKRPDQRPILSDLRDSGAIEQDADIVVFVYRDMKPNAAPSPGEALEAELIVAKHRNGPTGTVHVKQRLDVVRFDP
jgi:replicative DNA helicase